MSARLARALRAEGGLVAGVVRPDPPTEDSAPAATAAGGPRSAGHEAEVALLVGAIHEGYLLHYDVPRTVHDGDADLALLTGDRLYALGLDRLARLGDLEAVAVLADVIAECAEAHAAGQPARAASAWDVGARAVGWGPAARRPAAPSKYDAPRRA